jgi:opacity protein-like surface antigen
MPVHRVAAAALALTLWAPPAGAQQSDPLPDYTRLGAYVGLGGTFAAQDFDVKGADFDDALGFNLRVGYRLHPRLSLEGEYEYLPEFSGKSQGLSTELEAWAATVNGKVFLLQERYQPFLLLGGGLWYGRLTGGGAAPNSETKVTGRLGLGIDVYATEQIVVALDWSYVIPAEDFPYHSIGWGLQYRF